MLFKDVTRPEELGMTSQNYNNYVAPTLYSKGAAHVTGGVYVSNNKVTAVRALIGPGVKQDFNPKYFQTVDCNTITFNLPCWQTNCEALSSMLIKSFNDADEINFFFAHIPYENATTSAWTNWFYGKVRYTNILKESDGNRNIFKVTMQKC